ncbi:hypothetical protein [Variovorax sp. OV700]|uniref:hypothetical protein n=1 Tax=Variovorax sp. OV700 TaxID=1882826 RepID=UPI001587B19B|nr:hypothetical protein [Variovorax sp. OV700]
MQPASTDAALRRAMKPFIPSSLRNIIKNDSHSNKYKVSFVSISPNMEGPFKPEQPAVAAAQSGYDPAARLVRR